MFVPRLIPVDKARERFLYAELWLRGRYEFYSSLSFHEACDPEDPAEFELEEDAVHFPEAYFAVALLDLVQEIDVSERPFALKRFNDCQVERAGSPDLVH
jgi:hypothetical protein